MRISDWSSDVCSSDLTDRGFRELEFDAEAAEHGPKASGAGVERRFAFALLRRGAPFFSNLRSFATERPFKSAHLSPPIRLHPIHAIFSPASGSCRLEARKSVV